MYRHKRTTHQSESFFNEMNVDYTLLEVGDLAEVLVTVVEVLAAHAPDKGVVVGSGSGMDRPFG